MTDTMIIFASAFGRSFIMILPIIAIITLSIKFTKQ